MFCKRIQIEIMNLFLKNLLPSRKKNSEFIDIYIQKLTNLTEEYSENKVDEVDEEAKDKSCQFNLPFQLKTFINSFLIFIHELCFLSSFETSDKKIMKLLTKAKNVNESVQEIIKKIMKIEDIEIIPLNIVKMQDEQRESLEYTDILFKSSKYPQEC